MASEKAIFFVCRVCDDRIRAKNGDAFVFFRAALFAFIVLRQKLLAKEGIYVDLNKEGL